MIRRLKILATTEFKHDTGPALSVNLEAIMHLGFGAEITTPAHFIVLHADALALAHDIDALTRLLFDFQLPVSTCKRCNVEGKHAEPGLCAQCEIVAEWELAEDARGALVTERAP